MSITAIISTGLKVVLGLLGIWKDVRQEAHDKEEQEAGKNEIAAEELKAVERARQERDQLETEVKDLSDADLDKRLNRWMRH